MLILGMSFGALLLSSLVGCSDICEDLSEICARCVDEDYKQSCEETVRSSVQGVCSGRRAVFNDACPYVADATTSSSSSSASAGGGGATASTATAGGAASGGSSASGGGASAGGASAGGASAGGSGGS